MSMDKEKLKMIAELMEEIQSEMEWNKDDLSSRLGSKKPEVEVASIEIEKPELSSEESDEMDFEEMDSEESDLDAESMYESEMSPEEKLKKRLMKLRG